MQNRTRNMQTLRVGDARVTLLNAGDMRLQLSEEMAVPEAVWRPLYGDAFVRPSLCPSLSVYIQHAGARVLVDANDYRATVTPDSEFYLPDYTPPPPIPDQLAGMGAAPDSITHVVITHAHWDHFAGATTPAGDGSYAPTYPRARYYLGAADWRDAEMQAGLQDAASLEARTLGVLDGRGMLHLVEGRTQLADGIDILPAPGETPGHQIVRVSSGGETLYIVGDLFHSAVEVEHPDWMVTWADAGAMEATRRWLLADALAEQALLVAAHIVTPGRIAGSVDSGLRWTPVETDRVS